MKSNRILNFVSILVTALALSSCALYPDIPEEYLEPKKLEKEEAKSAATPIMPMAPNPKRTLPSGSEDALNLLTEPEKQVLVSAVFKKVFGTPLPNTAEADVFPALIQMGNEVNLTAYFYTKGKSSTQITHKLLFNSGKVGNIVENAEAAAEKLVQKIEGPGANHKAISFLIVQIDNLQFLLLGRGERWVEVVGSRPYLPLERFDLKVLYDAFLLNNRFIKSNWKELSEAAPLPINNPASLIDAWLRFLSTKPVLELPDSAAYSKIKQALLDRVKPYDSELSFIPNEDGTIDLMSTTALVLMLTHEEDIRAYPHLEPLANTLFFLLNEEGSFQAGVDSDKDLARDDSRVPYILRAYHALYLQGDNAFLDGFNKAFHYYFREKYWKDAVETRVAWARLLLDIMPNEKFPFERHLKSNVDWFLHRIIMPGEIQKEFVGALDVKESSGGESSRQFQVIEMMVEAQRLFRGSAKWRFSPEANTKLFFALQNFLNKEIRDFDFYLTTYPPNYLGGFRNPYTNELATFQDQMISSRTLRLSLSLWGKKGWEAVKERAEAYF